MPNNESGPNLSPWEALQVIKPELQANGPIFDEPAKEVLAAIAADRGALPTFEFAQMGRIWQRGEVGALLRDLGEFQIPAIGGSLFGTRDQKLILLGLLLMDLDLDEAVKLGDPARWVEAVCSRGGRRPTGGTS